MNIEILKNEILKEKTLYDKNKKEHPTNIIRVEQKNRLERESEKFKDFIEKSKKETFQNFSLNINNISLITLFGIIISIFTRIEIADVNIKSYYSWLCIYLILCVLCLLIYSLYKKFKYEKFIKKQFEILKNLDNKNIQFKYNKKIDIDIISNNFKWDNVFDFDFEPLIINLLVLKDESVNFWKENNL